MMGIIIFTATPGVSCHAITILIALDINYAIFNNLLHISTLHRRAGNVFPGFFLKKGHVIIRTPYIWTVSAGEAKIPPCKHKFFHLCRLQPIRSDNNGMKTVEIETIALEFTPCSCLTFSPPSSTRVILPFLPKELERSDSPSRSFRRKARQVMSNPYATD